MTGIPSFASCPLWSLHTKQEWFLIFFFKSLYFHDLETYSNRTFVLKIRLYWYLSGIVLIFVVQKVQTVIKWVLTEFTPDFLSSNFSSVPYNTILSWLYMFSFRNSWSLFGAGSMRKVQGYLLGPR